VKLYSHVSCQPWREFQCQRRASDTRSRLSHFSDHTASSFPLGSVK
jgi:hypothetical protein